MRLENIVCAGMLLMAGVVVQQMPAYAQDDASAPLDSQAIVLSSKPTKPEILVGEPLFIRVALVNKTTEPQQLAITQDAGLGSAEWRLAIAEGKEGPFRPIELSRVQHSVFGGNVGSVLSLDPDEKIEDWLTVWFSAQGDIPDERSLVFRAVGSYRYKLTFFLRSNRQSEYQPFETSGIVRVTGRPEGFDHLVTGLRGIIFDEQHVAFEHRKKLEALLSEEEMEDSPYADYIKWLRVRSYLRDGTVECPGENGRIRENDVLECGEDMAEAEIELLSSLSHDLLEDDGRRDQPPVRRDALLARGMVHIYNERQEEAAEVLKQVDGQFPKSKESRKLRSLVEGRRRRKR